MKRYFRIVADNDVGWGLLRNAMLNRHADGIICNALFRKIGQNHGRPDLDVSSGLEDPHGRFKLFQMRSTLHRHVGKGRI